MIKDFMRGKQIEDVLMFPHARQQIGAQYVNTYDALEQFNEAASFTNVWLKQTRKGKGHPFRMEEGLMGVLNRGLLLRRIILEKLE